MLDTSRPIIVIDTNVLVDYPEIIPGKQTQATLINSTVDLSNAHLVIPSAVIRELSSFKKEKTDRGKAGREVLKNLCALAGSEKVFNIDSNYRLEAPITLPDGRLLSVLPVHADFKSKLPFQPDEADMDGQIILATLTCIHLVWYKESWPSPVNDTRHSWFEEKFRIGYTTDKVTLLTNDNGLAIRARARGITTRRYSHEMPAPYTGRRDVTIPKELFNLFWDDGVIDRDLWDEYLPNEKPLVANEFVVFSPDDTGGCAFEYLAGEDQYFRHIGRYDASADTVKRLRYISEAPFRILNDGQAMYAEALLDPSIAAVICTGPAGSGKTYLPTIYGIDACQKGLYTDVVVVPCEDFGNLGALPGGLDEKMSLDVGPIRNALRNYLLKEDVHFRREFEKVRKGGVQVKYSEDDEIEEPRSLNDRIQARIDLLWRMFFRNIPVKKAKGLDFSYELVIYDEFQDQSPSQADMLIKRVGEEGKIVITGDIKQIHAPYLDENNNGIVYALRQLYDCPMAARVSFLKDEVERHPLVRLIAERQAKKTTRRSDEA